MRLHFQRLLILAALGLSIGAPSSVRAGPRAVVDRGCVAVEFALGMSESPHFLAQRQVEREKYRDLDPVTEKDTRDAIRWFDAEVKSVGDDQEGFIAKILMIRQAKHTVDINTFILTKDPVGYAILNELKKAHERGIAVRILVDGQGSTTITDPKTWNHSELKALLGEGGFMRDDAGNLTDQRAPIEVALFNPLVHISQTAVKWYRRFLNLFILDPAKKLPVSARWRNRRMHDKILAVDADYRDLAMAMVGGRNLEESYYSVPTETPKSHRDFEMIVRNAPETPQAKEIGNTIGAYFGKLYYHHGNKVLAKTLPNLLAPVYQRELARMDGALAEIGKKGPAVIEKLDQLGRTNYFQTGFEPSSVRFVHDIQNIVRRHALWYPEETQTVLKNRNYASVTENLKHEIRDAQSTVDIVSPFLYLAPDELEHFRKWLTEPGTNRKLRIVTNSIGSSGNMGSQGIVDNLLGPFAEDPALAGKVELWQYGRLDDPKYHDGQRSPAWHDYGQIHAKMVVIDGRIAYGGSTNGDPRSRYLDSEVGYLVKSAAVARQATARIDELISQSYLWGSADWKALRDHPVNLSKCRQERIIWEILRRYTAIRNLF